MLTTKQSAAKNNDRQLTEREKRIYSFLKATPYGVLATVDPNGNPHGTVIYFDIDSDFIVYFLTKTGTRKCDNIAHNNHVTLTVFEPFTQTVSQYKGIAAETTDLGEINKIAEAVLNASLQTSDESVPPVSRLRAGQYVAFKIKPVQIRMATYAKTDPGVHDELFESIESFDWPGKN